MMIDTKPTGFTDFFNVLTKQVSGEITRENIDILFNPIRQFTNGIKDGVRAEGLKGVFE